MLQNFQGKLGSYKVVKTDDGSYTLWSEYFGQHCHSLAGAIDETIFNYVTPCLVVQKVQKKPLYIFETGFGTGTGLKATLQNIPTLSNPLIFVSTELDPSIIEWAKKYNNFQHPLFPSYSDLTLHSKSNLTYLFAERAKNQLYVLLGDATQTVPLFTQLFSLKFNAFYQDAFSPTVNSSLWTTNWFSLLREIAYPDAILSTYSSAGMVRRNLQAAHWIVEKRQGFKQKREAIIAKVTTQRN